MNAMPGQFEVVLFSKDDGPLTKRISLNDDGSLKSDGSNCLMQTGTAERQEFSSAEEFASLIEWMEANQAIATGALRHDLPDPVLIKTKSKLNGHRANNIIARTADFITYRPGVPAPALIDIDTKGMPDTVRARVATFGGYFAALVSVVPELANAARVTRSSTSSCISRSDNGEPLPGSAGQHIYIFVKDGSTIEQFLRTFHDRCWLHGLGWKMVGAGGQLLDRSLVDRMVGAPERLVFEADPELEAPLVQDREARKPVAEDGDVLDALEVCPPLTEAEKAKLADLKRAENQRLDGAAASARAAFITSQAARIVERTGVSLDAARATAESHVKGTLLPDVVLPFDEAEFAGCTVGDVLADPERFIGATLADPLEGPQYGIGKAKVLRRPDGSLMINSFAHGRTTYDLHHDFASVEKAVNAADPASAVSTLLRLVIDAKLNDAEHHQLRDLVIARAMPKVKAMALKSSIKSVLAKRGKSRADHDQKQAAQAAANLDKRAWLPAPDVDAPRLPTVISIDQLLCEVAKPEPPMRDLENWPVEVRSRLPMLMHELTSAGSNNDEAAKSRLPAPELPLLSRHDKISYGHEIERHIRFVQRRPSGDREVALPQTFVDNSMGYRDSKLPRVGAIVTAPLVLINGTMLATQGLDRELRIVFRLEPKLLDLLPDPANCNRHAAAASLDWLLNEWLVDVSADFRSKCVLIAYALTIIERALLDMRPAFFITAGKRGGGKTTAISMVGAAVFGKPPPAAAWSESLEERRKALHSYFMEGVPTICFDNITNGSAISCKEVERACSSMELQDRVLGESRSPTVPSTTVIAFTGNNIRPKGDLASRSLEARINVHCVEPENRKFKHPDPIAWTLDNRGTILSHLYTLLLANPQINGEWKEPKTRFKKWWHLVGSAIENAAEQMVSEECDLPDEQKVAEKVDFNVLIRETEADSEDTPVISGILKTLYEMFSGEKFSAGDVAKQINDPELDIGGKPRDGGALRHLLDQSAKAPMGGTDPAAIGLRLKNLMDNPTPVTTIDGSRYDMTLTRAPSSKGGKSNAFLIRLVGSAEDRM
jgi:hypothetical protein